MSQLSFAEAEYAHKRRKTRRERFLEEMDALIPWKKLGSRVRRHYHKNKTGRPSYPLEVMRRFARLRLRDRILGQTTILNLRHFLEHHALG